MPFSYWPGGIPDNIVSTPEPVTWEELPDITKAWRLFIHEYWVPREDFSEPLSETYEADQRRFLMEEWVSVDQAVRDRYHDEVEDTGTPSPRGLPFPSQDFYVPHDPHGRNDVAPAFDCTCIAPLTTPRNRALWTKLRILLYNFEGNDEPILNKEGAVRGNPASNDGILLTAEDFLRYEVLECADFRRMGMTVQGKVVFYAGNDAKILADQKSLDTGMLLLCNFDTNGQVDKRLRLGAWDLQEPWDLIKGVGKTMWGIMEMYAGDEDIFDEDPYFGFAETGVDMGLPVLEILGSVVPENGFEGDADTWRASIEAYAPGYLEQESEGHGLASEYDHSRFVWDGQR